MPSSGPPTRVARRAAWWAGALGGAALAVLAAHYVLLITAALALLGLFALKRQTLARAAMLGAASLSACVAAPLLVQSVHHHAWPLWAAGALLTALAAVLRFRSPLRESSTVLLPAGLSVIAAAALTPPPAQAIPEFIPPPVLSAIRSEPPASRQAPQPTVQAKPVRAAETAPAVEAKRRAAPPEVVVAAAPLRAPPPSRSAPRSNSRPAATTVTPTVQRSNAPAPRQPSISNHASTKKPGRTATASRPPARTDRAAKPSTEEVRERRRESSQRVQAILEARRASAAHPTCSGTCPPRQRAVPAPSPELLQAHAPTPIIAEKPQEEDAPVTPTPQRPPEMKPEPSPPAPALPVQPPGKPVPGDDDHDDDRDEDDDDDGKHKGRDNKDDKHKEPKGKRG